jgi:hypothetical protein
MCNSIVKQSFEVNRSIRIKRGVTEKLRREKEECYSDLLHVQSVKLSRKANHHLISFSKARKLKMKGDQVITEVATNCNIYEVESNSVITS